MSMNSYVLGSLVRASVAFAVGGVATDPTTITAKVRTSAGVITTNSYGDGVLIRDGVGSYHIDIPTTAGGVWSYRFLASGLVVAANEQEFFVQYSDFGASG